MMGGGAAGLGALAMLPSASAFSINSDNPLSFNNPDQSGTEFEVSPSGDITSLNSFNTGNPVQFQDQIQPRNDIKDDQDVTVYDRSKKQVGDGTTQANHQSINTNDLNNTQFVDAADGASAVQTALDGSPSDWTLAVYSSEDPVSWSESVRVPSNKSIEPWGDYTITIPDSNNLDVETVHGGDFKTVIANKDFSGSATEVHIGSFTIDYQGDPANGSNKTQDQNVAPIWLHNATDSSVDDATVDNVLPDADTGAGYRPYSVQMSDCTDSTLVTPSGDNVGYEAYAIRGSNTGCEVIRPNGTNCGVHSGQVGYFRGNGVTSSGVFEDITVIEPDGTQDFTVHGYEDASASDNVVVERPRTKVKNIGNLDTVEINEPYDIVTVTAGGPGTDIGSLVVNRPMYRGDPAAVDVFDFGGESLNVESLTIRDTHQTADEQVIRVNGQEIDVGRLKIVDSENVSGGTIGIVNITNGAVVGTVILSNVKNTSTETVRVNQSGTSVDTLYVERCDLDAATYVSRLLNGGSLGSEIIDGKGEAALGGSAPDATNWPEGVTVEDTDNAGDLYYIYDNSVSSGATQIGT